MVLELKVRVGEGDPTVDLPAESLYSGFGGRGELDLHVARRGLAFVYM